jgi:hypothetical protein
LGNHEGSTFVSESLRFGAREKRMETGELLSLNGSITTRMSSLYLRAATATRLQIPWLM